MPKEALKTCGTCFYSTPRKHGHWTTNDLICLRHAVSTHSERHHVTACGWGIAGPRGWRPKEPDTLKQRCQQLEQLAKEMLRDQGLMAFAARKQGAWGTVALIEDCMKESRKRLDALGVSMNDYQAYNLVLSIKPEHAEAIFSRKKTVEYRKQKPRANITGVYIHVCGEDPAYVQGYAGCSGCTRGKPRVVWGVTKDEGAITEKAFFDYFGDAEKAYALRLFGAMRLAKPIPLSRLGLTRPPQGLAYVKGTSDD